jgi:hypothetical protein
MPLNAKSSTFFKIALSSCILFGCERLSHKYMHGFSYQNFTIKPPKDFHINQTFSQDLTLNFNQPFSFLGYGGESLVFASEDQKWVLKVFKKHRLYPFDELLFIKSPQIIAKNIASRQHIYKRFWASLKLQAEKALDDSLISYIHFPSQTSSKVMVTLIDPCGSRHNLNLSKVCFIVQKKGDLFEDVYLKTPSQIKRISMLKSVLMFYQNLTEKGLFIWDNAIYRNLGWIDNRPFLIDTGSIKENPSFEDISKNLSDLKAWVLKNDPDVYETFLHLVASHKASDSL